MESYGSWLNSRLSLERERSNLGIARSEVEEAVGGRLEGVKRENS